MTVRSNRVDIARVSIPRAVNCLLACRAFRGKLSRDGEKERESVFEDRLSDDSIPRTSINPLVEEKRVDSPFLDRNVDDGH